MTIQTTSNLSNAIGTRYTQKYQRAAGMRRVYDQLAEPIGAPQYDLESRRGLGTTYTFNFLSGMTPGTTALSESADITPQILRNATSTVTPTSLGEALKWSELIDLEAYTDYVGARAEILGENAMESIDNLAMHQALSGSLYMSYTARASLDAGTALHNFTEAAIWKAQSTVQDLRFPRKMTDNGLPSMIAICHPDAYYDLFHSDNVLSCIKYGSLPGVTLFNGEVGTIAGFRIVSTPWAKVFMGAGNDGDATAFSEAPSVAIQALDKHIHFTTGTEAEHNRFLTVGLEETKVLTDAGIFYDTNERCTWVSGTTTSVIVGSGANGGLRFDHAIATTLVFNSDSVYPVAYGFPGSLVKVYANEIGEFGQVVGPKYDGLANQWQSLAWKFNGGYGRMAENTILRGDYASSLDTTK